MWSLLLWSQLVHAAEYAQAPEARVKAAFLLKFPAYVDWPASAFAGPGSPITFAVAGADAVADALDELAKGRTVGGRPVAVVRLKQGDSLAGVNVLFIGDAEVTRVNQLALGARPRAVLTVTESDGALARGSIINFVISDRRVRFEISLNAAEKSGLKLSSRLLAVARHVYSGGR